MATNVLGLFDLQADADMAVGELIAAGIPSLRISVIAADSDGTLRREVAERTETFTSDGAATGAASGLLIGGMLGLLVATVTVVALPVGLLIAGPVAGLLTGAGVGAVSGGLLGGLVGLGLAESDADVYAESIRRGSTLIAVDVTEAERPVVENIISACGAVSISERAALYREGGFDRYDPTAPLYTEDEVLAERARMRGTPLTTLPTREAVVVTAPDDSVPVYVSLAHGAPTYPETSRTEEMMVPAGMDEVFRQHFMSSENIVSNFAFEQLRPAYRYGYEVAEMPGYSDISWAEVLPWAKEKWEARNPGTWDTVASAVHYGWSCLAVPVASASRVGGPTAAKVL